MSPPHRCEEKRGWAREAVNRTSCPSGSEGCRRSETRGRRAGPARRAPRGGSHPGPIEIDLAAAGRARPCCGGAHEVRRGQARTGAQRWRCRRCGRHPGRGSPARRSAASTVPCLFVRAQRGMMGEAPRSCRKLARVLGVSRHTVWRWRMIVIHALPAERTDRLAGIVEADEAPRRESEPRGRESGSDTRPTPSAIPDRLGCPGANTQSAPPSGCRRRAAGPAGTGSGSRRPTAAGTVRLKAIGDVSQPTISAALLPIMAPDAVLCTDGLATYGKIAKDERIPHFMLVKGRRNKNTPKTHHINDRARPHRAVPGFPGPVLRSGLTAYRRWHAARDDADRDHHAVLRTPLEPEGPANTLCRHRRVRLCCRQVERSRGARSGTVLGGGARPWGSGPGSAPRAAASAAR